MDLRCAPWTQAQGVDPIGSAASFDTLVLVERPLPWPQDVSGIPELAAASARPGVRVMAVVPDWGRSSADGLVRVAHHRRQGTNRLAGVDHRIPPDRVESLLEALLHTPGADSASLASAVGPAPPEVLMCAHGRRDACCGRWGTLVHAELAARGIPARLSRCSHTGGHRFAPTAITLPEGRAWAYVDADLLERVVSRRGDVASLLEHDRGTSALDPWGQVVERGVFEHVGWGWLDHQITDYYAEVAPDARLAEVEMAWKAPDGHGGRVRATVEVVRQLPVLVCGEPPERAVKSSPEFALGRIDFQPDR